MAKHKEHDGTIGEMAIVDIFTKLIFDSAVVLEPSEQHIIDVFAVLESTLTGASRRDVSEFLRAMTIEEMISAVNQLKIAIEQQGMVTNGKARHSSSLHR
jgi:hypothetical protein